MTDQLLQAIEERLAQRRRASIGTMTDERREKALMSLLARARNGDPDAKERVERLLKLWPQISDWVAEQMALGPPIPEAEQLGAMTAVEWERIGVPLVSATPANTATPFESIREMTRRQTREAGETPSLATPDPPKPEWYEGGQRPGLQWADQLKKLFGPKSEPGDGGWMRKR
jgi:hypothetical protein